MGRALFSLFLATINSPACNNSNEPIFFQSSPNLLTYPANNLPSLLAHPTNNNLLHITDLLHQPWASVALLGKLALPALKWAALCVGTHSPLVMVVAPEEGAPPVSSTRSLPHQP
jgi:hypothetical protein